MVTKLESYRDSYIDTQDLSALKVDMEELTKKKEIVQPVQVTTTSSKRIVRLRKIVGCGCGDSFLEFNREVDASDPLQNGDMVDNLIKGDKPVAR